MALPNRIYPLICGCLALVTLLLTSRSSACGVLTHNEIFRRSRYLYSLTSPDDDNTPFHRHQELISKILSNPAYRPAEQAGAFFPDWGYGCFKNDAPSEAAHWPPFLIAAARYLNRKYGPIFVPAASTGSSKDGDDPAALVSNPVWPNGTPLTVDQKEHKEKLIAFIFAAALHQSSDATWHSLKMDNGFIRMVAAFDFAGSYNDAHTVVDTGGDIILANRMDDLSPERDEKSWVSPTWWMPVDDLTEIYTSMGLTVNKLSFRFCFVRGLAAITAEVTAGGLLFETFYAEKSPAMIDFFDEYYLGGMDEMAASAVWCWRNLTEWVAVGAPESSDGWDLCDIFKLIKSRDGGVQPASRHKRWKHDGHNTIASLRETSEDFEAMMDRYQDNIYLDDLPAGAVEMYIQDADSINSAAAAARPPSTPPSKRAGKVGVQSQFPGTFGDPIYVTTGKAFSKFGSYLSIGSHGTAGLAAGKDVHAAQAGSVDLTASAFTESEGQDYVSGGAVYSIDLTELIRSQQLTNAVTLIDTKNMLTRVSSRNQRRSGNATDTTCHVDLKGSAAVFTSASDADDDDFTPPLQPSARFGAATTPLKVNGVTYNVVTAPGASVYNDSSPRIGFVSAGYMDVFLGAARVLRINFADFPGGQQIGEREFGTTVLAADVDGDGVEDVVLGLPFADGDRAGCGVQLAEGEVVVVKVGALLQAATTSCCKNGCTRAMDGVVQRVKLPVEEKRDLACAQSTYEWFGKSLVWMNSSRTLGVGAPGSRKVFFYKWDAPAGEMAYVFAIAAGDDVTKGAGFGGWGLESGVSPAGTEWIAIGVPNDSKAQVGHVRVYTLAAGGREAALVTRVISRKKERFGKFGMVLKSDGQAGLWVASPWAHMERGALWWVNIGAAVDGNSGPKSGVERRKIQTVLVEGKTTVKREVKEVVVEELMGGPEPNCHFGASIAVADIDGDGRPDLVIGIPFHGMPPGDENARFAGAFVVYVRDG
ncbi:hypothetical protein Dda_3340 [Drechslerella dactyloides]|uniref:Phosphatidylinositol-glycan-specific phospholipase D n=1 Tax=Drechslerella dactyloides TaxID=74499 RepID=A0AAD6J141_DREDA|nr:hypothetical protein Dda_3340 [Drechslerella dactyloides]